MERTVNFRAALYGRRSGSELLLPLELPAISAFFPTYSPHEQIESWAVLGGMPYYLSLFDNAQDLHTNIRTHILNSKGTLFDEPLLLLVEELRKPRNYFSVLRAIAAGHTRMNEISQAAGIGAREVTGRYLDVLRELRIVRRLVPITERQPEKSRKGVYQIDDAFLRFWFRYVHPNRGLLELGLVDAVMNGRILPTFDAFVGRAFEEATQEHITRLARGGHLPFIPERIGRWWSSDEEIDIVAISDTDRAILVGECKWTARPVGVNILVALQRKAQAMQQEVDQYQVIFALFARNGFSPELKTIAAEQGILLVETSGLLREMTTWQ